MITLYNKDTVYYDILKKNVNEPQTCGDRIRNEALKTIIPSDTITTACEVAESPDRCGKKHTVNTK